MAENAHPQTGADAAAHDAAGGPGGFAPHPLFFERMQRLQTAIACGTPDRAPISLVMDLFAANAVGASYTEYVSSVDRAAEIMLAALDHHRVLRVDYIPSSHALRVQEPEDLSTVVHCTATGKVLLAAMPPADRERYLSETSLKAFTPRTA